MKKTIVIVIAILLVVVLIFALVKCSNQNIGGDTRYNDSALLKDMSNDFKNEYGKYVGYEKNSEDITNLTNTIVKSNTNKTRKVYVELMTPDDVVFDKTASEPDIRSIPSITKGCSSYTVAAKTDKDNDEIITILSLFE